MATRTDLAAKGHIRWGFIGCGDVTEVKSGPAFARVAGSSVSVVMRRDAAKARDYAERHGVPRWTSDADEVIGADDVDAVYVATPPSSHAEYVRRTAAAGKPVYVEKPMARTHAEGEAMVRDCEQAGVPLFVAYYRRALPRFEFVRERLRDGAIGEPTMVRMDLRWPSPAGQDSAKDGAMDRAKDRAHNRAPDSAGWRWDPAIAGDGLLLDLGSHGLDLLDHWLGPIAEAGGHASTRLPWSRVKDEIVGSFRFASGVLGAASWSFAGPSAYDLIAITGSSGSLEVPLFADGPVRITDAEGRVSEHAVAHPRHVHEPLVETIVGELLGRGTTCPSTGTSALRTQWVMDELLRS